MANRAQPWKKKPGLDSAILDSKKRGDTKLGQLYSHHSRIFGARPRSNAEGAKQSEQLRLRLALSSAMFSGLSLLVATNPAHSAGIH